MPSTLKISLSVTLFLVLSGFLNASVNLSGIVAVNVEGVTTESVGVLVADTGNNGFVALYEILSENRDRVLDSKEDYNFISTGYQPIATNMANDALGFIVLPGGANFDIVPSGGSAVLPGDSFALVVFANPNVAGSAVLVFAEDDWVVPADGSVVSYGSDLTQLNSESTPDFALSSEDDLPPDGEESDPGWYADAGQINPSGWRYFDWFKGFKPEGPNWIFHGRHGWLYVQAEDTSRMFLWDGALGRWMFTNETVYPWMYAYGPDEGWVFFFEGGSPGARFFKRGDTGQVVSEQQLGAD